MHGNAPYPTPSRWEVVVDPNKSRWDTRIPAGDILLDEAGFPLIGEDGAILEAE